MIGIIAFLVSGIGLVALIFAICGAINKNTCLCITAIIIGAVCILLAIAFWIAFAIIISRKVALENKYCQTLKTACCSGTYIASNSYKQFACSLENSCWADPFSYTVYAICKGSFSGTISGLYCSGTSRCEGTAVDQTSAVCSLCSITGSCSLSSYYSSDISSSGNYCK